MKLSFKPKFRGRTIAFLTIVPLLVLTALIRVPCPVCDGTGYVSSTPGMESVSVLEIESKEHEVTRDACGVYTLYRYDIKLSLLNEGNEPAQGWVGFILYSAHNNQKVDEQYVEVEIPAQTRVDSEYVITFGSGLDQPQSTYVRAEVLTGDLPDPVCSGRGTVPLNLGLFVDNLKDTLAEQVRAELEYQPPVSIDWEDYVMFNN